MDTSNAEPSLLLLYPLFFVVIWIGISATLAKLGGWRELAQHFPAAGRPVGELSSFASAAFRTRFVPVHYASCLIVGVSEAGLRLAVLLPFRALHPPLLIPWTAIKSVTREAGSLGRKVAVVAVRSVDRRIAIYGKAGEKVAAMFDRVEASASIGSGRRSLSLGLGEARPLG